MADLAERIQQARRDAAAMQEQIKANKEKMHDTTLRAYSRDLPHVPKNDKMRIRRTLKGHLAKIYAMQWADKSTHIVSASQDGKLLVWDGMTTNKLAAIPLRSSWVMTCGYSPSGQFVACGGLDNICSVFNLRSRETIGRPCAELIGHVGFLACCKFLDDRHMLTSSGDMTSVLWDLEQRTKITEFTGHTGEVMSVSISPDKNTFVSGSSDATAKLWDLRIGAGSSSSSSSTPGGGGGACVQTFVGHETDLNAVQYFPSGHAFGSGSDDSSCRLFDIRASREMMAYALDDVVCAVTSVAFSISGRYLFAGYDDHKCLVWDTIKGERMSSLQGHTNRVSCLGVSSDGMALCTGSWDSLLRIWA
eukprot:TRINITY_DN1507_c0_g1_i2.p1 TRINITY_DN1507_c0_g1~~TRINITY_DN1507_c0_g1_i2.p1  ORF type:complete len:362 (-),score=70.30 TRINITY_DN1507_c0_g1_i2:448-1533(-)